MPVPGGKGAGILYKNGSLQALEHAELHTKMFVFPDGLNPSGSMNWLYTTATNRTDDSIEVVGIYASWKEYGYLGIWDWSCNADYPCTDGSSDPGFQWSIPFSEFECNMEEIVDKGGHYQTIIQYANISIKLDDEDPPLWRHEVKLWNFCDENWDLIYQHDSRYNKLDCSLESNTCAFWGPILETFGGDPYPEINELGFEDTLLLHDGTWSELASSETGFIDPIAPWELFHHDPNRGYGVGNYVAFAPPLAGFFSNKNGGETPLRVDFTNESQWVITDWLWDFGDGGTSSNQNPIHTYDIAGVYTVSLTVIGPGGSDTTVKSEYIIVGCENHLYFKDADGDGYGDPSDYVHACTPPSNYIAPAGVFELVTNGTMENDSDWGINETPTVNERSTEQIFNGNFSRKFTADRKYDGIKSNSFTLTAGETYRTNLYAYGDGAAPMRCLLYMDGDNNSKYYENGAWPIPPKTWSKYSWSYTPTTTGSYGFGAQLAPTGTSGTFYIDDVSITQALDSNSDCNDTNKLIYPGADEICNGLDDNCDGQIDEGAKLTYYQDQDSDGFGNPIITIIACSPPNGYVADNTDLCDNDINKVDPGSCGCGNPDTDTDKDGTPDCNDSCPSDPNKLDIGICGCGVADSDTDKDNTPDCIDNCQTDPNKINPGTCACGISDVDSDKDGKPDCLDNCDSSLDSDGDGLGDCDENCPLDKNKTEPGKCGCGFPDIDTDLDGTPDCNDRCPNDPNKTTPGICGCGIEDTDADNDGVPECIDTQPFAQIVTPDADKEITVGDKIKFQCSVTGGNTPYQYTWDFDGGASDFVDKDPGEVEFAKAGVFKVTLFVYDNNGDMSSDSVAITVTEPPPDNDENGGGGGGGGGCFFSSTY